MCLGRLGGTLCVSGKDGGGGGRGARRYLCVPGGLGGTCVSRGRMGGLGGTCVSRGGGGGEV